MHITCLHIQVLFRYALAIFKLCEEGILERSDYLEIFNYLRSVPEPITDIPRLQEVSVDYVWLDVVRWVSWWMLWSKEEQVGDIILLSSCFCPL